MQLSKVVMVGINDGQQSKSSPVSGLDATSDNRAYVILWSFLMDIPIVLSGFARYWSPCLENLAMTSSGSQAPESNPSTISSRVR
jgi:hypothetical protein